MRTGRIFTGDASGRFLVEALYEAGFANQPISENREDGLVYNDCYLTAAVKCAPPGDKPSKSEFANCSPYLAAEISMMKNMKVVLALGSMAFGAYLAYLKGEGMGVRNLKFTHGARYAFKGHPTLFACYHPSPRNTNTGTLTKEMLSLVMAEIKEEIALASI